MQNSQPGLKTPFICDLRIKHLIPSESNLKPYYFYRNIFYKNQEKYNVKYIFYFKLYNLKYVGTTY